MRSAAAFLLGVLCAAAVAAAPRAPSKYVDATYGFSIDAPGFPAAGKAENCTPAIFFAPPREGFATNVNVLIQGTDLALDDYIKVSRQGFKQANATVVEEQRLKVSGRDAVRWEYTGKAGKRDLRWLALAVPVRGRVYLVTATVPEAEWPDHEKTMRACLDSFGLIE